MHQDSKNEKFTLKKIFQKKNPFWHDKNPARKEEK